MLQNAVFCDDILKKPSASGGVAPRPLPGALPLDPTGGLLRPPDPCMYFPPFSLFPSPMSGQWVQGRAGCGLTLLSLCQKVCSRVGDGGGEHVPTCLKYHLLASPTLYILWSIKFFYYQPVHLYNENEGIPIWAVFLSDLPRTFPGSLPCLMLQVPAAWYW